MFDVTYSWVFVFLSVAKWFTVSGLYPGWVEESQLCSWMFAEHSRNFQVWRVHGNTGRGGFLEFFLQKCVLLEVYIDHWLCYTKRYLIQQQIKTKTNTVVEHTWHFLVRYRLSMALKNGSRVWRQNSQRHR